MQIARANRRSAETTGDVALGLFVLRIVEHGGGVGEVLQVARLTHGLQVEEARVVGDTRGLLHVMRHDHDGVVVLQLVDQILHGQRRDRVERGARLVHEQHLRPDGP